MNKEKIIEETAKIAREKLEGEASGHDWWHTYRVWKMALRLANEERGADSFVVQLAALLHDIEDWKFHGGDHSVSLKVVRDILEKMKVGEEIISQVCEIIKNVSFKGAGVRTEMKTKEGMIVQDADRLDALGAIGIARTFAYGAKIGNEMYNPEIKPVLHKTTEEYIKTKGTSLNHFYEKLLLLKDLMNTKAAKKIARERHDYLQQFLERFLKEWEGKK